MLMPGASAPPLDVFWSLYQSQDQVRIDGLRLVQVHTLLRSFSYEDLDHWFAWFEGSPDWVPLSELTELLNASGHIYQLPPIPPRPPRNPNELDLRTEKTITRNLMRDGRVIPRFQMSIDATVDYKGKLVRTQTVDISLAGMKIKDPLPFPTDSIVIVTLNHRHLELVMRCRIVDAEPAPKHRLMIEKCHRMDLLRAWIVAREKSSK